MTYSLALQNLGYLTTLKLAITLETVFKTTYVKGPIGIRCEQDIVKRKTFKSSTKTASVLM